MSTEHTWQVGDKVRTLRGCDHFYSAGDVGAVFRDDGSLWVDFKAGPGTQHIHRDGVWAVDPKDLEPA